MAAMVAPDVLRQVRVMARGNPATVRWVKALVVTAKVAPVAVGVKVVPVAMARWGKVPVAVGAKAVPVAVGWVKVPVAAVVLVRQTPR